MKSSHSIMNMSSSSKLLLFLSLGLRITSSVAFQSIHRHNNGCDLHSKLYYSQRPYHQGIVTTGSFQNDKKHSIMILSVTNKKKDDIDELSLEVEEALQAAQDAIDFANGAPTNQKEDAPAEKKVPASTSSSTESVVVPSNQPPSPPKPIDPVTKSEAIAAGGGGLLIGAVIGFAAVQKVPELELYVDPAIPPILIALLTSVSAYVISLQPPENPAGAVTRTLLGKPTKAVVNSVGQSIEKSFNNALDGVKSIPGNISAAVSRQAKRAQEGILAIPSRISNAAKNFVEDSKNAASKTAENAVLSTKRKIQETADEIKSIPQKVVSAAKGAAVDLKKEIQATPTRVVSKAKEIVESTVDSTERLIEQKVESLKEEIKATPGRLVDSTTGIIEQTVDTTKSKISKTVQVVKKIPAKTVDEIKSTLKLPGPDLKGSVEIPKPPQKPPPSESFRLEKPIEEVLQSSTISSKEPFSLPKPPRISLPKIDIPPPPPPVPQKMFTPKEDENLEGSKPSPAKVESKPGFFSSVTQKLTSLKIPEQKQQQPKKTPAVNDSDEIAIAVMKVAAEERKKKMAAATQKETFVQPKVVTDRMATKATADKAAANKVAAAKAAADKAAAAKAAADKAAAAKAAADKAAARQKEEMQRQKVLAAEAQKRKQEEMKRAREMEMQEKQFRKEQEEQMRKQKIEEAKKARDKEVESERRRREAEEKKRTADLAAQKQKQQELIAAAKKKKEIETRLAASTSRMATLNIKQLSSSTSSRPSSRIETPKVITKVAPKGVPTVVLWKKRSDGGISGRIYGSPNFREGERIETSVITSGTIENGNVVKTKSGSRYFLSERTPATRGSSDGAVKSLLSALPGATIQLSANAKEKAARAAVSSISKETKPTSSTFSIFRSDSRQSQGSNSTSSSRSFSISSPSFPVSSPSKPVASKKTAPNGVPTVRRWRKNSDGSITGNIYGSRSFNDGEKVTTSAIKQGDILSGEVVRTGSGSRYFLE